ncbi:MAG: phosphoribosyltransferase domain-containing protein [Blautia sp.]|nr:phosphoribosyltransferase domain-containing protein [Blautia sp.]
MMDRKYTIDDLIRVAKRENNTKRSYLYVNPIQGKHIPVSPTLSLGLFFQMAEILEDHYKNEKLMVIGFAETATAIGTAIAYKAKNVYYYMNTTRENVPGAEYLFFTESHSHATEQRLVKNGLEEIIPKVDRIFFAEDEVTTGNTIEKLIRAIQGAFDCSGCKFGIISILNSMVDERMAEFREKNIPCEFLFRIPAGYRIEETEDYEYKPLKQLPEVLAADGGQQGGSGCGENAKRGNELKHERLYVKEYRNTRVAGEIDTLRKKLDGFAENVLLKLGRSQGAEMAPGSSEEVEPASGISEKNAPLPDKSESILVLGTEEFMFPAMLVGHRLEQNDPQLEVKFHATTRSPIEISDGEGYPLQSRYPLLSLYDEDRHTFIYNLKKYDHVIIITDALPLAQKGLDSLIGALKEAGNEDIRVILREE